MKRRSGTSSSSSPPEPVFFCDENLGRFVFPRGLRDENVPLKVHFDHFPQGTPDAEWLPVVGARGWILLTVDTRLRHNRLEQDAIMEHGVAVFVLRGGKTNREKADVFLKARSRIHRFLAKNKRPFIAKIYSDGQVTLWLSKSAWRARKERS